MQLLNTDEDFQREYTMCEELGRGGFAGVYLATREESKLAVKILNKNEQIVTHGSRSLGRMRNECRVHAELAHPHIVRLVDVCESPSNIYIVMERAHADLLQCIITQGALAESEALRFTRQLMAVLKFLHSRGVLHRDVKPENLLLYPSSHANGDTAGATVMISAMDIKLCDFGLAKILRRKPCSAADTEAAAKAVADSGAIGQDTSTSKPTADGRRHHGRHLPIGRCNSSVGSPMYRAPEQVFCRPPYPTTYGAGVDVWAAGCVTYNMLSASYPFEARTTPAPPPATSLLEPDSWRRHKSGPRQRWDTITHASGALLCDEDPLGSVLGPSSRRHVFPESLFATVNATAKSAIDAMLTVDPRQRPTAAEMLSHPWLLQPSQLGGGAQSCAVSAEAKMTTEHGSKGLPVPQPHTASPELGGGATNPYPRRPKASRWHRRHTITDEALFRQVAERLEVSEANAGRRGRERTWHEDDLADERNSTKRWHVEPAWRMEGFEVR